MPNEIKKIAVIGAGAMGSGIAAQAANAGYEVVLLDKRPDGADQAIERMIKAKPTDAFNAGFMDPKSAKLITTGNTDDHMHMISDADMIIEAVFEDLNVKHTVFGDIYKHAKPEAIISSNTSTIELKDLTSPFPQDFKERFINTHFFNPVRFMPLLEIIDGDDTKKEVLESAMKFGSESFGKKVIRAKDSPGFIGNRIGIYAMKRALSEALKQDTTIEDVDAIMGTSFGFPHLGLFKLADEVGIDIVYSVSENLQNSLHEDDDFHHQYVDAEKLKDMIDDGYTGKHKGKGGFYSVKKDDNNETIRGEDGKPLKIVRDLNSFEYRDYQESEFFKKTVWKKAGSYSNFFDSDDRAAQFSWPVLRDIILYTLNHAEEFAYDIQSIDEAMQAGYNWKFGPFQLVDEFGLDWFKSKLESEGIEIPALLDKAQGRFYRENKNALEVMDFDGNYNPVAREDGVIKLDDIKRTSTPLISNRSASLWDIGDGVVCFEFTSPMNSMDPAVMHALNQSIKLVSSTDELKAMVIYNDGPDFSIGANLHLVDAFTKAADHPTLKKLGLSGYMNKQAQKFVGEMIFQGQAVYKAMREAPFPVIAAPKGTPQNKSLGGGCEILLWADAIQAGPETVIGLVEAGVGLIPGWGGTTRFLARAIKAAGLAMGPMPSVIKAALSLADPFSSMALNARDAKNKLWLAQDDGISMNPDRVLGDAKSKGLEMAQDYTPPEPSTFFLPGVEGKGAIQMDVDKIYLAKDDPNDGGVNAVDLKVIDALADILTGGETITKDKIKEHTASHHDHLRKLASEKPDGKVDISTGIELTEQRLLHLEWQRIMTLANDPDTQARIEHMVTKGKPLREPHPDDMPKPKEVRDSIELITPRHKAPDGKPLSWLNGYRLKRMADITEAALAIEDIKNRAEERLKDVHTEDDMKKHKRRLKKEIAANNMKVMRKLAFLP